MSPSNLCILHKFRFLNELVAISHGTMNSNIHRVYILIFAAFCLLSVIFKQWLKQHNYYFVQSELLNRLWTDFSSSIWNFCCCGTGISPGKIPLMQGARRDSCFCRLEKQLFENVFFYGELGQKFVLSQFFLNWLKVCLIIFSSCHFESLLQDWGCGLSERKV